MGHVSNLYIIAQNRILRRIFGPKRDENGEWRRQAGHVARKEEGRSAFKILTGKPTGKRPLGRPRLDGRTILKWTLRR